MPEEWTEASLLSTQVVSQTIIICYSTYGWTVSVNSVGFLKNQWKNCSEPFALPNLTKFPMFAVMQITIYYVSLYTKVGKYLSCVLL